MNGKTMTEGAPWKHFQIQRCFRIFNYLVERSFRFRYGISYYMDLLFERSMAETLTKEKIMLREAKL